MPGHNSGKKINSINIVNQSLGSAPTRSILNGTFKFQNKITIF
jgi:hypothetical protein